MTDEKWMTDRGWTILRTESTPTEHVASIIGVKIIEGCLRLWEVSNVAQFESELWLSQEETSRLADWLKPLCNSEG